MFIISQARMQISGAGGPVSAASAAGVMPVCQRVYPVDHYYAFIVICREGLFYLMFLCKFHGHDS